MKKFIIVATLMFLATTAFCQAKAFQVVKAGKGKPVLFLPGFTTPGSVWNETISHLSAKKETHIISYAGFNGIASIDTPWYATIKEQLLQYIVKEKLSHLTIIGHSMGGTLAIDIAAALPGKVDKLILVDALPCLRELMMPGVPASQIQYNSPYNSRLLQMSDTSFRKTATMVAKGMTLNNSKKDTLIAWMMEADRKTYVFGYVDLLKLDLMETLKLVKAKTLIIGAPNANAEVTKVNFEKQYANLSFKTIEMANNSNHFIMFDQPDWFYNQVNSFLK